MLLVSIGLLILMLVEWLRSKNTHTFKKQTYFNEVFTGTKQTWWARSYSLLNYLRKALLVIWVVFINTSKGINIVFFVSVQIVYLISLIVLRPMETVKDNIIEILNEIWFSMLTGGLSYLHHEKAWNKTFEDIYYYLLVSNSIIVAMIVLSKH